MIDRVEVGFWSMAGMCLCALSLFFYGEVHGLTPVLAQTQSFSIACTSNSMGLTANCNDTITAEEAGAVLYPGSIYVYKKGEELIVHRLVYCPDNCSDYAVFKGDNNLVGERVNRSDILYRVVSNEYR